MRSLRQSTAYPLMIFMTDSADHVSGKTGLTLAITASKNGAAFASISPTVTERGNGWYLLDLTTSHTDTLGDLAIHVTATGADPTDLVAQVRAEEAIIATNLDATVSSRSAPGTAQTIASNADITAIKAKTDTIPVSPAAVSDIPSSETNAAAVRTNLSTELGRIDAAISTRSAPGTAQTITAPADMALNSTVAKDATVMKSAYYTAPDNAGIAAIKAKTDNLPASPAASSDIPSASTNAGAVRTELATELSRVDASISSRLASGAYTAPDNTGIGQINARLPSDPADQSLIIAATDQIRSDIAAIPSAPTAEQIAIEILDNQTA